MFETKKTQCASIRFKIGKTYSIVFLLLLLLILSLFLFYSFRFFYRKTETSQQRELSIVSNNINLVVNDAVNTAITFSIDSRILELMSDPQFASAAGRYNINSKIGSIIYSLWSAGDTILTWDIADTEGNLFNYSAYDMEPVKNLMENGLKEQLQNNRAAVILGPFTLKNRWLTERSQTVLIVAKPIYDIYGNFEHLGSCFAYINEQELYTTYSHGTPDDGTLFFLVSEDGYVLSSSDKTTLSLSFDSCVTPLSLPNNTFVTINDEYYLLESCKLEDYNWTLYSAAPLKNIIRETIIIILTVLFIFVLIIPVVFAFSFLLARRITSPITSLAQTMQSIESGNHDIRASIAGDDEITVLGNMFNHLMDTLETLKTKEVAMQQRVSDYRLQLLQAQINPHFLYNSLQTIISMVQLKLNTEAQKMLIHLSNFYRLSLSNGSDIIPLMQELELTRSYLTVQLQRYPEFFDFDIVVKCDVAEHMIPKLTLQPIVENAIYHGIKPKMSKGQITVSVTETQQRLLLCVLDDGVGMDESKIAAIFDPENGNNYGLYNVESRLKLMFGDTSKITIRSEQNSYTQVTISIPKGGAQ